MKRNLLEHLCLGNDSPALKQLRPFSARCSGFQSVLLFLLKL